MPHPYDFFSVTQNKNKIKEMLFWDLFLLKVTSTINTFQPFTRIQSICCGDEIKEETNFFYLKITPVQSQFASKILSYILENTDKLTRQMRAKFNVSTLHLIAFLFLHKYHLLHSSLHFLLVPKNHSRGSTISIWNNSLLMHIKWKTVPILCNLYLANLVIIYLPQFLNDLYVSVIFSGDWCK